MDCDAANDTHLQRIIKIYLTFLKRLKSGCLEVTLLPPVLYSIYTVSSAPDNELILTERLEY